MAEVRIRTAQESDAGFIKKLIHEVGINPLGLDWRRFVIATNAEGEPIGCGQLKPHGSDTIELASLAVVSKHQGQGVGDQIIKHLLKESPRPLYLTCRAALGPFYEKYGFKRLETEEMPRYFRRIMKLLKAYEFVSGSEESVLVMKLQ